MQGKDDKISISTKTLNKVYSLTKFNQRSDFQIKDYSHRAPIYNACYMLAKFPIYMCTLIGININIQTQYSNPIYVRMTKLQFYDFNN